ncbi:MAG: NAD(P)-dependent oxidoreductase [Pseudomonadota bacterium]
MRQCVLPGPLDGGHMRRCQSSVLHQLPTGFIVFNLTGTAKARPIQIGKFESLSDPNQIAFVGLGNMGTPMVAQMARAGQSLRVFDLDPERVDQCAAATGATPATSASEATTDADVLILMLPDGRAVSELLFAQDVAKTLSPETTVVDMSSSYPPTTRETGARLKEQGVTLLDAPVSGGVRRAEDGTLAIMLGGDDTAAIERVMPVLSSMGTVHLAGGLGSGHALKALNNYVSAAGLTAAAEALHVGQAFGLDPDTMIEVFNLSSGRNNSTELKFRQHILSGTFTSGFSLGLMAKDINAAADLAEDMNIDAPNLRSEADLWRTARDKLGAGVDHTEIYDYLGPQQAKVPGEDVS